MPFLFLSYKKKTNLNQLNGHELRKNKTKKPKKTETRNMQNIKRIKEAVKAKIVVGFLNLSNLLQLIACQRT